MMTPMVFCASCRPCPSAIAAADAVCASRKRRMVRAGAEFRTSHSTPTISANAREKPTTGDRTIGMTTLSRIAPQYTVTLGGDAGAGQPADEGVRGRRRQAEPPGDEVPA